MSFKERLQALGSFVRRNLLLLLFGALVCLQFLTWLSTQSVREAVEDLRGTVRHYGCGTRDFPCRVIVTDR